MTSTRTVSNSDLCLSDVNHYIRTFSRLVFIFDCSEYTPRTGNSTLTVTGKSALVVTDNSAVAVTNGNMTSVGYEFHCFPHK